MGKSRSVVIDYEGIELEVEVYFVGATRGSYLEPPQSGVVEIEDILHCDESIYPLFGSKELERIEDIVWEQLTQF